jgi:hypothetical protein
MKPVQALTRLSSILEHAFGYTPIVLDVRMKEGSVVITTIHEDETSQEWEHIYTFCDELNVF